MDTGPAPMPALPQPRSYGSWAAESGRSVLGDSHTLIWSPAHPVTAALVPLSLCHCSCQNNFPASSVEAK